MSRSTTKEPETSQAREQLDALVAKAKTARLTADEERAATELLRATLAEGRAGLAASAPAALSLPWIAGVTAFTEGWQALSATARRSLISALEKDDSAESSRRFRLSLARGLFPTDPATAEKLVTNVATEMAGEGDPSAKDRQAFANVLLGKAKPWLSRAPVHEWKGAKKIAAMTAFAAAGSPPFAQPGIVRWLSETGLLAKLPAPAITSLASEMRRWKNQQRKELGSLTEQLPDELKEALAVTPPAAPEKAAPQNKPAAPPASAAQPRQKVQPQHERRPNRKPDAPSSALSQNSRPAPAPKSEPFDLPRTLRQIDQEFFRLRNELHQARSQGSQRGRQQHAPASQPAVADPEEVETLRRCNAQLEERIGELREQLEDLATHHEDHATIRIAGTGAEQFRTLLSLKLQEDFEMFTALRNEAATEVVRRTLTDVLAHIFDVLRAEGVAFTAPVPMQ
jgi:hypothetical protein